MRGEEEIEEKNRNKKVRGTHGMEEIIKRSYALCFLLVGCTYAHNGFANLELPVRAPS